MLALLLLSAITLPFISNPTIGIVLCIGCIVATIILFYPILGLLMMVFFIPLETLTTFNRVASISKIIGLWACLAWFIHSILLSRETLKINNIFWLILTFCTWAWASILWSSNPEAALRRFMNISLLVGSYILLINLIDTRKRFDLVVTAYIAGCFVCALLAIEMFSTSGIPFSNKSRMALQGQNPNTLGTIIGLGIIFSWYFSSQTKSILLRFIVILSSMIFIYVLIMTQSRGAWTAFIVATAFFFWPVVRKVDARNILILALLLVCIISAIVLLPYLFPGGTPFLQERFTSIFNQSTMSTRTNIWKVGINMWKDNPILGVGLNNFPSKFNQYSDITFNLTNFPGYSRDPHNVYLSVICELGLVGFTMFFSILYYTLKTLWKNDQLLKAFLSSILVLLLIVGFKGTIIWSKYYWLVIGLIGASFNFGKELYQFSTTDSPKKNNKP